MQEQIIRTLVQATHDVFETMVFRTLTAEPPIEDDAVRPRSNVVATVGFAGSTSGVVAVYTTLDAANAIAGAMLGIEPTALHGQMPDAIGEVANMIAGSFRTKMAADGDAWAISIPTVTIGSDFHTKYVSDVRRVLCPFRMQDGEVYVELIVTKTASARV